MGFKFLRQHPILTIVGGKQKIYIADFYCHAAKLVLELDGPIHERQKEQDAIRDLALAEKGLRVLRVRNETIYEDVDRFLELTLGPELTP